MPKYKLVPEAVNEAREYLNGNTEALKHLEDVSNIIRVDYRVP